MLDKLSILLVVTQSDMERYLIVKANPKGRERPHPNPPLAKTQRNKGKFTSES